MESNYIFVNIALRRIKIKYPEIRNTFSKILEETLGNKLNVIRRLL